PHFGRSNGGRITRMIRAQFLTVVIVVVFAVAVTVTRSPAFPAQGDVTIFGPTGSQLLESCNDVGKVKVGDVVPPAQLVSGARHVGMCEGYIAGIHDATMFAAVNVNAKTSRVPYCLPTGVEMSQMIRVVKKSLEDNPAQLHLPSSVLVVRALKDAFPC